MLGFGKPSELKTLHELLIPGEVVDEKIPYVKAVSSDNVFGILVITNRRIIFTGSQFFQSRTDDFLFENIASISSASLFPLASHHRVTIATKGCSVYYDNVPSSDAKQFAQRVRELIIASSETRNMPKQSASQDYIFCMKCGQQLPASAAFCMKCGNKI